MLGRAGVSKGTFRGGMPFVRLGTGSRPLIVFDGLGAENKVSPMMSRAFYGFLGREYTVYVVTRRPGLPRGYTMTDIAGDYAAMIREEFGGPVDVIGISTGGAIALHFAADHPDLPRRLVLHSSAHSLNESTKQLQRDVARDAEAGDWGAVSDFMAGAMVPGTGPLRLVSRPLGRALGWLMARRPPADVTDLVVTVEAEDRHEIRNRLHEIRVPTFIAGSTDDPYYSAELFRETAEGIPGARLAVYRGKGHAMLGRRFERDVLRFLAG